MPPVRESRFLIVNAALLPLAAILLFSMMVLTVSSTGMGYWVLIGRIRKWKILTGYKRSNEFELPDFNAFARLYVKKEKKS